jgi:large subunit ribosomal protein L23
MVSLIRNSAKILGVIRYPCMTLKAKILNEKSSQIVIFVEIDATKIEIKKAVEAIFGMKVEKVNTLSARRYAYKEKDLKKAVIFFKDKELAKKMTQEENDNVLVNSPLEKK